MREDGGRIAIKEEREIRATHNREEGVRRKWRST